MKLIEIRSDPSFRVERDGHFSTLGFAHHRRPGMLTFLASEAYVDVIAGNESISCVIATEQLASAVPPSHGVAVCDDPRLAFYRLHNHLATATTFYGFARTGSIAVTARIHPTALVATGVIIEDEVEIGPMAVILPGVHIGAESVIRAGSVIGSEGFQAVQAGDEVLRIAHAGTTRIGQRVDIHANCCVDRGLFAETTIADDTTLDSLVYIAHEVNVGRRCRLGAHAVVNGSVVIGDAVWIGPGAIISDGISVGAGASVTLGAVVTQDVPHGARVTGHFAIDRDRFLSFLRSIRE